MNNNRKKYVQINNHTFSDQILALLDNVQSDDKEDIEELMNNSDTEFFANDEDLENIVPNSNNADMLTPEASILKENASPLEVYEKVVNLDVLIELLVTESTLYSQQNGHHFITNPEKMKAFLGTNCIMVVNQLPNISMYWQQWYSKHFSKG